MGDEIQPDDRTSQGLALQNALQGQSISVETIKFMSQDDEVNNRLFKKVYRDDVTKEHFLGSDPEYELIDKVNTLVNSHVVRTSILSPHDAKIATIRLRILIIKLKAITRNKGAGYGPLIDSLGFHWNSVIRDQMDGHRSKLWQEKKVVATVQPTIRQKKKPWWRR